MNYAGICVLQPPVLSRPRLLNHLLTNKINIVTAMPGSGKSDFLTDVVHHSSLLACQVVFGEADRDVAHLANHFKNQLLKQFPQLQNLFGGPNHDELLLSGNWVKHIEHPFVIALDDFHFLDGVTEAETFVNKLLNQMPSQGRFVIASCTKPKLNPPHLVGANHLSSQELAFEVEEIQALLAMKFNKTITPETAELLYQATNGWVTGVLAFAHNLNLKRMPPNLYNYFKMLFDEEDVIIQQFLLKTASLELVNTQSCQKIFGEGNWATLINQILERNLFVTLVEPEEDTSIKYHSLFHDFLKQLGQALPQLAKKYTQQENWTEVHKIYHQLDNMTAIADLIELVGLEMWRGGQQKTLLAWIDALPEKVLNHRSDILLYKSLVKRGLGKVSLALMLQNQAIAQLQAENRLDKVTLGLVWRAMTHQLLNNYKSALSDAEEALRLIASADDKERYKTALGEGCRVKGLALGHSDRASEALDWLQKSFDLYLSLDYKHDTAIVAQDIGAAYTNFGHVRADAEYYYEFAYSYWQDNNNEYRMAAVLNDWGVLCFLHGEYFDGFEYLEQAVTLARKTGYQQVEASALAGLGDIYSHINEGDCANQAYEAAYKVTRQITNNFLMIYVRVAELMLACRQQNKRQIKRKVQELEPMRPNSPHEVGLREMGLGHAAFALKNHVKAVTHLRQAVKLLQSAGHIADIAQAQFLLGCLKPDEVNPDDFATHPIQPGVVVLAQAYPDIVREMKEDDLLEEARFVTGESPFLRQHIRQAESVIERHKHHLNVCVFGSIQVFLNGSPLSELSEEAKLLLYYLVSEGRGLTAEEIGVLFWPDEGRKYVEGQVKLLLKGLRQTVGRDTIVLRDNRYIFNQFVDCVCDVDLFEALIAEADTKPTHAETQIELYEQAVHIYDVPCPTVVARWPLARENMLRHSVTKALHHLATFYQEREVHIQALDFCLKAIYLNPLAEDMYRLGMELYKQLGNEGEIVRLFNDCRAYLKTEFDTSPSFQTVELFERLVGDRHKYSGGKNEKPTHR